MIQDNEENEQNQYEENEEEDDIENLAIEFPFINHMAHENRLSKLKQPENQEYPSVSNPSENLIPTTEFIQILPQSNLSSIYQHSEQDPIVISPQRSSEVPYSLGSTAMNQYQAGQQLHQLQQTNHNSEVPKMKNGLALNIQNYVPLHGTSRKSQHQQNIEINDEEEEADQNEFQYIDKSNVQFQNIEEQSPVQFSNA